MGLVRKRWKEIQMAAYLILEIVSGLRGPEVLFHQAVRFNQRNWIPQVEEGNHLTVSVSFLEIIYNII